MYRAFDTFTTSTLHTAKIRAMYRSNLGEWSAVFMSVNPGKHPSFSFDDEQFLVLLRKRFGVKLHCVDRTRGLICSCGQKDVNEEHIFKCVTDGCKSESHSKFQMALVAMQKHAGIISTAEDLNCVPGDGQRRHADTTGHDCKLTNSRFNKFGTDCTLVSPDLRSSSATRFAGSAARRAEAGKRKYMNTEINLNNEGILYVPLAVEMNGFFQKKIQQLISPLKTHTNEQIGDCFQK